MFQKLGTKRSTARSLEECGIRDPGDVGYRRLQESSKHVVNIVREIHLAVVCPLSSNMPTSIRIAAENQRKITQEWKSQQVAEQKKLNKGWSRLDEAAGVKHCPKTISSEKYLKRFRRTAGQFFA